MAKSKLERNDKKSTTWYDQMRHIYSEYDAIEILTVPSIKTTLIPSTIKIIKHANLKY